MSNLIVRLKWLDKVFQFIGLDGVPKITAKEKPDYLIGLFLLAGLILVFLAILLAFKMLLTSLFFGGSDSSSSISSLGLGALVVALLSAPFVIWRSWVAHQDYKVKEQGHITDRINKAVEGLGSEKTKHDVVRHVEYEIAGLSQDAVESLESNYRVKNRLSGLKTVVPGTWHNISKMIPNIEVRIGAIYALERIAQDSLRDHIQIMEILCAYIRENAPNDSKTQKAYNPKEKLRLDIQVALTVIGRRSDIQIKLEREKRYKLDLTKVNLDKANLRGLNFDKAVFSGSSLRGVDFMGSNLNESVFNHVCLDKALLNFAELDGAEFRYVNFLGAGLIHIKINGTTMEHTDFSGIEDFDGVNFAEIRRIWRVSMNNVDLSLCKSIKQSQLNEVFADASVILPEGVNRPKHWPNEDLGDRFDEAYQAWVDTQIPF